MIKVALYSGKDYKEIENDINDDVEKYDMKIISISSSVSSYSNFTTYFVTVTYDDGTSTN